MSNCETNRPGEYEQNFSQNMVNHCFSYCFGALSCAVSCFLSLVASIASSDRVSTSRLIYCLRMNRKMRFHFCKHFTNKIFLHQKQKREIEPSSHWYINQKSNPHATFRHTPPNHE